VIADLDCQKQNRARDSVTPANLAAFRKLLDERGLLAADEFDNRLYKTPAGVMGEVRLAKSRCRLFRASPGCDPPRLVK